MNSSREGSFFVNQDYRTSFPGVYTYGELHRPRLLQSIGCCVLGLAHTFVEKAACLPFPFGAIIEYIEDMLNPWLHPFISAMEGHVLCLLAFVDDRSYALGSTVVRYSPIPSGALMEIQRLQEMLEYTLLALPGVLRERGFTGICADLWVSYEVVVKEHAQKASALIHNLPLLSFVIPAFCVVVAPIAATISDWLVKHSELKVQSIHLQDKESLPDVLNERGAYSSAQSNEAIAPTADVSWSDVKQESWKPLLEFIEMAEEEDKGSSLDVHEEKTVDPLLELLDSGWHMGSIAVPPRKNPSRS